MYLLGSPALHTVTQPVVSIPVVSKHHISQKRLVPSVPFDPIPIISSSFDLVYFASDISEINSY